MHLFALRALFILGFIQGTFGEENLLRDPDFEDTANNSWECNSAENCLFKRVNSPYTGRYAGMVYDRTASSEGCRQEVTNVKKNTAYKVSAQIKLLNSVQEHHSARIIVVQRTSTDSDREQVAIIPDIRLCDGWVQIAGDFITYDDVQSVVVMVIVAQQAAVEYLVDSASLVEIHQDPQWKEKADVRIEQIRKGNLIINLNAREECCDDELTIRIKQKKSYFPIGSSVQYGYIVHSDEEDLKYQDYFYGLFNWATPNSECKWRFMEQAEKEVNFEKVDQLAETLWQNGVKMRGHTLAWGKEDKIVDWLKEEGRSVDQVSMDVQRRIEYMLSRYSNKIDNWDVLNENIEGMWFEEKTGNREFGQSMFRQAHSLQPNASLFMNDYAIVTNGKYASAYRRKAGQYLGNGVPVSGLGIQSHVRERDIVDIGIFQYRLDHVASAGVPLWITELDIEDFDVNSRASKMADLIHLYFSHPSIEGIILWGFWSETNDLGLRGASLVDGSDFIENETGKALRNLVRNAWWTDLESILNGPQQIFRVFHGEHDVTVHNDLGEIVWQGNVAVEKGVDKYLTVDIE